MMLQLIRLEAKKMFRQRWIIPATLLMIVLLIWSFENRAKLVSVNRALADSAYAYQQLKKVDYLRELDSATLYGKKYASYSINPLNPNRYNNMAPQIAVYRFSPLAVISTGQSDLFGEEYLISAPAREPGLKLEDISNPMHRLFGNIDPSFVLVFLLPLLIIAAGYNFIAGERETDTLKLLQVQNVSFEKWVWAKLSLHIFFFSVVFVPVLLLCLWRHGAALVDHPVPILGICTSLIVYIIFWCLSCLLVNLYFKRSSATAIVLAGLWMVFVFVLPSLINLISNAAYKIPSRVEYIRKYRSTYSEAERNGRNEMLNKYFFDHPELSKPDTGNQRYKDNLFAIQTIALYENIRKATTSLTQEYEQSKQKSIGLASILQTASPSALFNAALNDAAGTSEKQYLNFNSEAGAWRLKHLDYIKQKVFSDAEMKEEDVLQRDEFRYQPDTGKRATGLTAFLLLYCITLFIAGRVRLKRSHCL